MADERIGIRYVINLGQLDQTIRSTKKKIKDLHNFIEQTSQKTAQKATPASEALKKLGVTADMSSKQIKALGLSHADMQRVLDLSSKRMRELTKDIGAGGKVVKKSAEEYRALEKRMPALTHEVNKGKQAFGDYRRAMDRWGAGFKFMIASQAAWIASGLVLFTVIRGIGQGLRDVITLHQEFKNLAAITQANAQEMELMEDAIRTSAVATKFFAADMTKAAKIMAQAGFSAQEVAQAIHAVAVLASATGRELEDVADLMTTIIRAYGLHASEADRIANVLAAGISESKLQIEDLKTAFNFMAVAASQFNVSVEQTVAWLGVLRDRGLKASTIGTSFRGVLATLVRETQKFSKVLKGLPKDLGFSDISIRRGRKLEVSMKRLADAGFTMSDAFMGLRRRTAMTFALMVENVDIFDELTDKVTGTNRAFEMNEITMQGLASQLAQTKSIFDEFMAGFTRSGGAMEPFVRGLKLIVKVLATLMLGLSNSLAIIGKAGAGLAAIIESVPADPDLDLGEAFVPGDKSSTLSLKIIGKDIAKDILNIRKTMERIWGKKGFFSENLTKDQEEIKKTRNELSKLFEKRAELRESQKEVERGSDAWERYRGQLAGVNTQIDILQTELFGAGESITGGMQNLQDVMLDLVLTSKDFTKEDFIGVFRKGADDIDLMTKATKQLKKSVDEAFDEWDSEIVSRDSEQYARLVALVKLWLEAQKKLNTLRTKGRRQDQKELDDQVKAEGKRFDQLVKSYTREIKEIEKFEKARERIDTKYAKFKRQLDKDLAKADIDDFEKEKAIANERHRERLRLFSDMLEKAKKLRDRLKLESKGAPLLISELGLAEEQIKRIQALLKTLGILHKAEMKKIADPKDIAGGIKKGFKDATEELSNEYAIWRKLTRDTMMEMRDTMSDVFFDAMEGELKTADDYWKAFKTSIKRYIAEMAAAWVVSGIFGTDSKASWVQVILTALGGIGGGSDAAVTTAHQGGLQKMRGGGMNSNEFLRILKNNEFVMKDSTTRSIGVANMEYMDRTGQIPQQQKQTVIYKNSYYIDAMDAQSFDAFLRTRGARAIHDVSLNSVGKARERGDVRVSR